MVFMIFQVSLKYKATENPKTNKTFEEKQNSHSTQP
jgi:hypothetical protein